MNVVHFTFSQSVREVSKSEEKEVRTNRTRGWIALQFKRSRRNAPSPSRLARNEEEINCDVSCERFARAVRWRLVCSGNEAPVGAGLPGAEWLGKRNAARALASGSY